MQQIIHDFIHLVELDNFGFPRFRIQIIFGVVFDHLEHALHSTRTCHNAVRFVRKKRNKIIIVLVWDGREFQNK